MGRQHKVTSVSPTTHLFCLKDLHRALTSDTIVGIYKLVPMAEFITFEVLTGATFAAFFKPFIFPIHSRIPSCLSCLCVCRPPSCFFSFGFILAPFRSVCLHLGSKPGVSGTLVIMFGCIHLKVSIPGVCVLSVFSVGGGKNESRKSLI